jgi:hypothetical protein
VNKILSLRDPSPECQLSKKQINRLKPQFKIPTSSLAEWKVILSNLRISVGDSPEEIFQTVLNLSRQCYKPEWVQAKKGEIPLVGKKVSFTCTGFYHGDNPSDAELKYKQEIQRILLYPLKKQGLLFIEDGTFSAPKPNPIGIATIILPQSKSSLWYLQAIAIYKRASENPTFKPCNLLVPKPSLYLHYEKARDVEINNRSTPEALLPSASVTIQAVRDFETPTSQLQENGKSIFTWTSATLFSAHMACIILKHCVEYSKELKGKISIGCGKVHEAQITAFLSDPQLLHDFLVGWTTRINKDHQTHMPWVTELPFDLKASPSPIKTATQFVAWMTQYPSFF